MCSGRYWVRNPKLLANHYPKTNTPQIQLFLSILFSLFTFSFAVSLILSFQLEFYLEALDSDVKKESENPSAGLILCADKDDAVVEYALRRSISPALVANYQLHLPNKKVLETTISEPRIICVEEHIRKLPENWKPSSNKIATAVEHGFHLDNNQTWVDSYSRNYVA